MNIESTKGKTVAKTAHNRLQTNEVGAHPAAREQHALAPAPAGPRPDRIMQTGLGFWASKTLLSGVELGLFTELGSDSLSAEELQSRLGLHTRGTRDFLDALVALGFLERREGRYSNTAETAFYLDRNKEGYIGGILEMASVRLYGYWGSLTEGLKTGQPQNEAKSGGDFFANLYSSEPRLEGFLKAMTGISLESARAIARKFPWAKYKTFADIGGAQGAVAVQVALANPHLTGMNFDLPKVGNICQRYFQAKGVSDRVKFQAGDFLKDPLPHADVLIMGHILHDWDLTQKRMLLDKAYAALPDGGALIVHEALIDDGRRENAFGLLMSLNMLIETPGGFDYTGAECQCWMQEAGFSETRVEHLAGPDSMVVGIK